jgi:hypothetical protein
MCMNDSTGAKGLRGERMLFDAVKLRYIFQDTSFLLQFILVGMHLRWQAMASFSISGFKMRSTTPQVVNFAKKNLKNTSDTGLERKSLDYVTGSL